MSKNREGQLLVRTIIEMYGAPKEHVEETLKGFVTKLKEEFDIEREEYAQPEERDKMFSAFVELEMWFANVQRLFDFCFEAMPSSVEVLEPHELLIQAADLAGYLNELQARLHTLDMEIKKSNATHEILSKNAENLFRNIVGLALTDKQKKIEELSTDIGIREDELKPLLDKMEDAGLLTQVNGFYKRVIADSARA